MASSEIKLDTAGLDAVLRRALSADGVELTAGVQGTEEQELLTYAASNEFGTQDGHVPERSFIRSTAKAQAKDWTALSASIAADMLDTGTFDMSRHLDILGAVMVGDIQDTIRNLRTPPNAASTIARKGSDNPLVDTGRLRLAITYAHTA